MKNNTFLEIGNRILDADSILIYPHVHMDGDALGSSSALCIALRKLGKTAYVVSSEATPANLDFLEYGCVTRDTEILDEYDLALMVDCGSLTRITGREEIFKRAKSHGVIDHHGVTENDVEFDFGVVEADSAATGELIYLLIKEMGWEIDLDIASALWVAITTDTGNFQHNNTTARSHVIASELHSVEGFDSKVLSNLVYNRNSLNAIKLESLVMNNANIYDKGRVIISRVTQAMLHETGTRMDETDGFIQKLMSINGVEVGCILKEHSAFSIKASLRSKAAANVARVAQQFEGGGHIKAAGCTIRTTVDEAENLISEALIQEVETTC